MYLPVRVHPLPLAGRGLHLARPSAPQPVPHEDRETGWLRRRYFILPKIPSAKRPDTGGNRGGRRLAELITPRGHQVGRAHHPAAVVSTSWQDTECDT